MQGWIPVMRGILVRLAMTDIALMDGSCAIERCESCQVGNQAALSSFFGVPRGRLSGAVTAFNTHEGMLELRVYGLTVRLLFLQKEEVKRVASRSIPQMAVPRF